MTNYPRTDGVWAVYLLQSLHLKDENSTWGVFTWVAEHDTRELCEAVGFDFEETTLGACGDVWQESGIHGTENFQYATILLHLCRLHEPKHTHRIVKMTVTRATEILPD